MRESRVRTASPMRARKFIIGGLIVSMLIGAYLWYAHIRCQQIANAAGDAMRAWLQQLKADAELTSRAPSQTAPIQKSP